MTLSQPQKTKTAYGSEEETSLDISQEELEQMADELEEWNCDGSCENNKYEFNKEKIKQDIMKRIVAR